MKDPASFVRSVGGLVSALVGGYGLSAVAPPSSEPAITRFILICTPAGIWALAWILVQKPKKFIQKTFRRRMLVSCVIGIVALAGFSLWYMAARDHWTVPYQEERRVIGDELTEAGETYFAATDSSATEAVFDNGGVAEDIWTPDSINAKRRLLWWLHVPFFASGVFVVVFAWLLVGGKREPSPT